MNKDNPNFLRSRTILGLKLFSPSLYTVHGKKLNISFIPALYEIDLYNLTCALI